MKLRIILLIILLLPAAQLLRAAPPEEQNPHAIFCAHYQATGGLQRWQALRSSYSEGNVTYDGLSGTVKIWEQRPIQVRVEEDYGVIRESSGDSGECAWRLDYNGQLEVMRDPETLKRRQLAYYLSDFEHLNPHSSIFSLTLEAASDIDGRPCHVVCMKNSINSDVTWYYFAVDNLFLLASITHQPDIEIHSRYSDFRQVDGLSIPFSQRDDIHPRQKHRETKLTHVEIDPNLAASRFVVPEAQPTAITFPAGCAALQIPFLLAQGAIYLPVTVKNDTKWWVLDSGASSSVIDEDYARGLGLVPRGQIKGFGFCDNFDMSFVAVPQLQIGSTPSLLSLGAHTVMAYAGLADSSYEPLRYGILGYDFLSRFIVRIDYARRILTLYSPQHSQVADGQWIDAPLTYRMFTLPVQIDDRHSGRWSIDIGAEHSSFYAPYAQRHHLLDRARARVEHVSQGLSGLSIDYFVRFESLTIAGFRLERPILSVPGGQGVGMSTVGELAGNLGASVLDRFILWLDYSRQRVRFEPGELYSQPVEVDKSGLLVGMSHHGQPMVSYVAAGSPAMQDGFVAGDIIEAIDGRAVASYGGVLPIRKLLLQQTGRCYRFKVQRAGELLELTLCLQDIL
ncbi:MAG: aspartyl protease family protein [Thermodesulfobacteriota bacterium]|nr:aspartyl protease family protein [Thermodesulfobacteriota bacterium]